MARADFKESALDLVAPGTALREALDNILLARTGALIVIGDLDAVEQISDGGFALDAPFEPQRLFELSKMDGAILLDEECTSIIRANVHLVPDPDLPTLETGIRHRTAERVSLQTEALVVAISQRRAVISLYRGGEKLVLEDIDVVLAKANQALQTLQRYRTTLGDSSLRLTALEFQGTVTLDDVVAVIQRSESMDRVAREVARYVSELGSEGRLVRMQSEELMGAVEDDYVMLLRDYCADPRPRKVMAVKHQIAKLKTDQLLDGVTVAQLLGRGGSADLLEQTASPRGYRLLHKIPLLPGPVVHRIVDHFGDLPSLLDASKEELLDVDGVAERRAEAVYDGLERMRQYGML